MKKNFLLLPGTIWQEKLMKEIKSQGHNLFVVNPTIDCPGYLYADGFLCEDIFNKEKVTKFAINNKIDSILSDECDIATTLIAELGKILNIRTIDEKNAQLYTDKFQMREFSRKIGLNTPEYKLCYSVEEAKDFLHSLAHPIIIKPTDSNASHGVFICKSEHDIEDKFAIAFEFSRNNKAVLCERYIEGKEFTIDGIKLPSGHYSLSISEKDHFSHNVNIANELLFSHRNDNYDYELLKSINDKFVNSSTLEFGLTHAEYKFENGKFYMIEIGARGGGNNISSIITPFMSGIDLYKLMIDYSLGKNLENRYLSIDKKFFNRCAILKFFSTPNKGGTVREIIGEDLLRDNKYIRDYRFNFKIGDTLKDAENDSKRIGYYIACAPSREVLNEIVAEIEEKVIIVIE